MRLYCRVENGQVVDGPKNLPVAFEIFSDFDLLERGWHFAERVIPDNMDYNTEVWETPQFEILPTKVRVIFTKRNKTQEEMDNFILEIRTEIERQVSRELEICNTQLNNLKLTADEIQNWQLYKTQLESIFDTSEPMWKIYLPRSPITATLPPQTI